MRGKEIDHVSTRLGLKAPVAGSVFPVTVLRSQADTSFAHSYWAAYDKGSAFSVAVGSRPSSTTVWFDAPETVQADNHGYIHQSIYVW